MKLQLMLKICIVLVQLSLKEGKIISELGESVLENEYIAKWNADLSETTQHSRVADSVINDVPKELDWRNHGVVTAVKNQGNSGTYLVPLIVEMIESELAVKTGKLNTLSLQQISDCCSECKGQGKSQILATWKYIGEFGLESGEDYPEQAGTKRPCKYNSRLIVPGTKGTKFEMVTHGNETSLEVECAARGPVFVMVDAVMSFQLYSGGIFYAQNCDPSRLNHAMLLVGYGAEETTDYWLVKNSWGVEWGDGGYAKMSRNRKDNCGIANFAFTAVFPQSHRDDIALPTLA